MDGRAISRPITAWLWLCLQDASYGLGGSTTPDVPLSTTDCRYCIQRLSGVAERSFFPLCTLISELNWWPGVNQASSMISRTLMISLPNASLGTISSSDFSNSSWIAQFAALSLPRRPKTRADSFVSCEDAIGEWLDNRGLQRCLIGFDAWCISQRCLKRRKWMSLRFGWRTSWSSTYTRSKPILIRDCRHCSNGVVETTGPILVLSTLPS